MRSFLEVEHERLAARLPSAVSEKTIHRSSLLVPEMPGYRTAISFLNHFLLKRNIPKVSCRITAVGNDGARIGAKTIYVEEPRVYFIDLTALFANAATNSYVVEFFSADNLGIPFPAVMINHFGDGTVNIVHAYNRVVNDVFEQDNEVSIAPAESSIDVKIDETTDTFSLFCAGPQDFQGEVSFELATPGGNKSRTVTLDLPRLTQKAIGLKEVMPGLENGATGVLRIRTPSQFLFFGRLLAGQRTNGGAFSANHTYYNSSTTTTEYFKSNAASWMSHAFIPTLRNVVTVYPFFSKASLEFGITLFDKQGAEIRRVIVGELEAPSADFLSVDVNSLLERESVDVDSVGSFRLEALPLHGNTPTRIPHQVNHHAGKLASTVVYGMINPNGIEPARGFVWGQLIAGRDYESTLGISRAPMADRDQLLTLDIYGEEGLIKSHQLTLPPGSGRALTLDDLVPRPDQFNRGGAVSLWYVISAKKRDFFASTVVKDRFGNCTGEHSF